LYIDYPFNKEFLNKCIRCRSKNSDTLNQIVNTTTLKINAQEQIFMASE